MTRMPQIIATMLVLTAIGALASAADIRLQDEAGVRQDLVRLRDIAELEGEAAQQLGEQVVATLAKDAMKTTVTLESVRALLDRGGAVNWADIRLRGHRSCTVYRLRATALDVEDEPRGAQEAAPIIANAGLAISPQTSITLRQRAVAYLQQYAGGDGQDLTISFDDADEAVLNLSVWQQRWEFEPSTKGTLGRIPMVIRKYGAAGEVVETHRITAQVVRRTRIAMTVRSMSRGQLFTAGDVEMREVELSDDRIEPITELSQVIGLTCGRTMRANAILAAKDVQLPLLVKRGELVTVRSIHGTLVVRMVGRAAADGGRDELIRVRNDGSGDVFTARVIGAGQALVVNDPTGGDQP